MSKAPSPPSEFINLLARAQHRLDEGFANLPPAPQAELDSRAAAILDEAATRLQDNYPYGHPFYAGQMLKPPHPISRAAYALAMSVNPNNHALDGGRASSAMEVEAVDALAKMFHLPQHLGHLSSGGTFANLEALWVAGQLAHTEDGEPKAVAASDQAHYTHSRITGVLGLPFISVPSGNDGRLDLEVLEALLAAEKIGTVVATLGTTAIGSVDPLDRIVALQKKYAFRIHVDAAYGGYFTLASNLSPETRAAFEAIPHADSIVIDPHKHGLQPYGCGCILFRDPAVGRLYKHDSPYTYFSSKDLHLGEISLECSRAGASAVALWATQKLLPLEKGGEFARGLEDCRKAAVDFYERLEQDERFVLAFPPELDIVVFAPRAASVSEASKRSRKIFDAAARRNLHLAVAELPVSFFAANLRGMKKNRASLTC